MFEFAKRRRSVGEAPSSGAAVSRTLSTFRQSVFGCVAGQHVRIVGACRPRLVVQRPQVNGQDIVTFQLQRFEQGSFVDVLYNLGFQGKRLRMPTIERSEHVIVRVEGSTTKGLAMFGTQDLLPVLEWAVAEIQAGFYADQL